MKKLLMFLIVLVAAIVISNNYVMCEENGVQFIYDDSYDAVVITDLELRDYSGNELAVLSAGEHVVVKGFLPSNSEKAIVIWNDIQGIVQIEGISKNCIVINILEQTLYMYQDGELICETPIVTGMDGTDRETPTGVFSIQYMSRQETLRGEGYESYVEYWMPFYYGYGIHDADGWRSMYGGDIYKYAGSHGCVNVPLENAKIIYENTYEGMLVIVK